MSKEIFITADSKRLRLRHLKDNDFATLFSYRNDPEVGKYQSWTDKTEKEIFLLIQEQKCLQPGVPGEWFVFAIQLKDTNILIGDSAFHINKNFPHQAELEVTLSREYQGKGYAREAISCVLNYVFKNFNIKRVVMITDEKNTHSLKLIKSLGFTLVNPSFNFENSPSDNDLYDLKNNELMFEMLRKIWLSTS